MTPVESFGVAVLAAGLVGLAAVLSNRVSERLRIPAPAIFLVCAAVASYLVPRLGRLQVDTVEQVVTVALAMILFNGGMHIGDPGGQFCDGSYEYGLGGVSMEPCGV
jgi:cell volume regulation protein A